MAMFLTRLARVREFGLRSVIPMLAVTIYLQSNLESSFAIVEDVERQWKLRQRGGVQKQSGCKMKRL
jgi:hypothetical protein